MNRYEYYDSINNYLQHAQSKLYGTTKSNHKYIKRVGKPGKYTYIYEEPKKQVGLSKNTKNFTNDNLSSKLDKTDEDRLNIVFRKYEQHPNIRNKEKLKEYAEELKELPEFKRALSKIKVFLEGNSEERRWLDNVLDAGRDELESFKKYGEEKYNLINAIYEEYAYNYWIDYLQGNINPDPYGLKKREKAIEKGQIIFQDLTGKEVDQEKINNEVPKVLNIAELIDKYVNDNMTDEEKEEYKNKEEEILKTLDASLSTIRQEEKKDPETGLPIKAYNCTIEEDMLLVNYHRQLGDKDGYTDNCRLCTMAMVLRQKGYDVSAGNTLTSGNATAGYMEWDFYDVKDIFKNDAVDFTEKFNNEKLKEYISQQPVGSYGNFDVSWIGGHGVGHSMFYRIEDDGSFQIYDCQIGQKVDLDEILETSFDWQITRLDDKDMNEWIIRDNNWTKYK